MSGPRLRVLHLAATTNGAPWLIELMREQRRRGHYVSAVGPKGEGSIPSILQAEGFELHRADLDLMSTTSFVGSALMALRLARLLRKLRPDVVQYHLFPSIILGRLASWMADAPLRFSMIPGTYYLEAPILGEMETGTAWCDTRVIATCRKTRELYIEGGVDERRIEVMYYGPDERHFDPARVDRRAVRDDLGIPVDAPVVGLVALFYPRMPDNPYTPPYLAGRDLKGHDVLLRAIPRVLERSSGARFLLVGGPWGAGGQEQMDAMKDLARSLGVEKSVVFTGWRDDIPEILASLDVALQCSLCENLGGSIEALLMEAPLVVTRVGGLVDSVRHEETGLVVPPDDPEALAAAIVRLLDDRGLAMKLGKRGRELMLEGFTVSRLAETLDDLYARTASEGRLAEKPHRSGYRFFVSVARTMTLPFRLRRLAVRIHRQRRSRTAGKGGPSQTFPWLAFLAQRAAELPFLALSLLRRVLRRDLVDRGRVRVAQVVGTSVGCEWMIEISRALVARGYDVIAVIDDAEGTLPRRLDEAGIRWFALPMSFAESRDRSRLLSYALGVPLAALRLARLLRRERVDLVHSHIFASILISRLGACLAGTPRHVSMIPGPRHLEARLTRVVDRLTQRLDDATIAGCEYTREIYGGMMVDHGRVKTIYYGADARRFDPSRVDASAVRREFGIDSARPVVGLVAQFYPPMTGPQNPPGTRGVGIKGHEHLLAAIPIVLETFPDALFLLVGDGHGRRGEEYRERLMRECAESGLGDAVVFMGYRDDVPSILAALDVAVQCSLTENLGGTVEALLLERPTVATRVGGMPESVAHEETGLLVPPGDARALAEAIVRLLGDRDLASQLGHAGRQRMLERFTLDRTVEDVVDLYARLDVHGSRGESSPGERPD